jgi:phage-related tail fiber protein
VKVWAANQHASTPDAWRLAIAPLGAADGNTQYIVYDEPLATTVKVGCTDERSGILLRATDVVRVRSLTGNTSFTATVYEEDA